MVERSWESERLLFAVMQEKDLASYHAVVGLEAVGKWLSTGKGKTREEAQEKIRLYRESFINNSYGTWGVWEKNSGSFIGQGGLMDFSLGGVELLYAFAPAYWGKGYATECAKAVLAYGFSVCQLKRIVAVTLPQHQKSQQVLLKAGFQEAGPVQLNGKTMTYFQRSRKQWQKNAIG